MPTIEQLWYTWSATGLEGSSRFQVRAASSGLADLGSRLSQAATSLCSYEHRHGSSPVSFGWIDIGLVRFAFHRVDAGNDGWGRPGNLFAHIVAGGVADLPVSRILASFGSALWRTSPEGIAKEDTVLAPLSTADLSLSSAPQYEPSVKEIEGFLASFVNARLRQRRLIVVGQPAVVVGMLVAAMAEMRLPSSGIEGVSLSTYEPGRWLERFDVVAVPTLDLVDRQVQGDVLSLDGPIVDQPAHVRSWSAASAQRQPVDLHALAAAHSVAVSGGSYDVVRHMEAWEIISALEGDGELPIARVLGVLRTPAAAAEVLRSQRGRVAIATSIVELNMAAWSAIDLAHDLLPEADLRRLGRVIGEAVRDSGDSRSAALMGCVPELRARGPELASEFLTVLCQDAATIALSDRIALLRVAERAAVSDVELRELLVCTPRDLVVIVGTEELSVGWRGFGLAHVFSFGDSGLLTLALYRAEEACVWAALAELDYQGILTTVLRSVVPKLAGDLRIRVLAALVDAARIRPESAELSLVDLAPAVSAEEWLRLVARWRNGGSKSPVNQDLSMTYLEKLGGRLLRAAESPNESLRVTDAEESVLRWLRNAGCPGAKEWLMLSRAASARPKEVYQWWPKAVGAVVLLQTEVERAAAALVALDALVAQIWDPVEILRMGSRIEPELPAGGLPMVERIAGIALRHTRTGERSWARVGLVGLVLAAIDQEVVVVRRGDRLTRGPTDVDIDSAVSECILVSSEGERFRMRDLAAGAGKPAQRWLSKHLESAGTGHRRTAGRPRW